jgi:CheY-like chemotaxis protein
MKVLVVDDQEQNRYQLQVLLGGEGYAVDTAANGADALKQARENPPDLIITDILMPVMDGFSLCREWMLDKRLKQIPLVFYTGTYTDEKDRKFALNLGAARFIVKPEELDIFIQTIEGVVASQKSGALVASQKPPQEEAVFLKEYNEALIRKLEDKNQKLEQANRQLAHDLAERIRAEEALRRQTEEVRTQNDELTLFNRLAVDRELRMIELKEEVNELCRRSGEPPRYAMDVPPGGSNPSAAPAPRSRAKGSS